MTSLFQITLLHQLMLIFHVFNYNFCIKILKIIAYVHSSLGDSLAYSNADTFFQAMMSKKNQQFS